MEYLSQKKGFLGYDASQKLDSNKIDIILGNISNGNTVPTKILLEKSGLGKSKSPTNKPVISDIIKYFSLNFTNLCIW